MTHNNGNIVCYFDGACEPKNPGGNMGIGATIRQGGKELFRHSSFVKAGPTNSNNVAEYMAFEEILNFFLNTPNKEPLVITIYGDSKLVINQMFGRWNIKFGYYVPFARSCMAKLEQLRKHHKVNGIWIRREQNSYADELSKAELINHNVQFKIQPLSLNPAN